MDSEWRDRGWTRSEETRGGLKGRDSGWTRSGRTWGGLGVERLDVDSEWRNSVWTRRGGTQDGLMLDMGTGQDLRWTLAGLALDSDWTHSGQSAYLLLPLNSSETES